MKEVINHVCSYCETPFKLVFDSEEIGSQPKFCPFCSEETLAEEPEEDFDDEQELD